MKKAIILAGILMLANGAASAGDRGSRGGSNWSGGGGMHNEGSGINSASRGHSSCRNDGYGNHYSDIGFGAGACSSQSGRENDSRGGDGALASFSQGFSMGANIMMRMFGGIFGQTAKIVFGGRSIFTPCSEYAPLFTSRTEALPPVENEWTVGLSIYDCGGSVAQRSAAQSYTPAMEAKVSAAHAQIVTIMTAVSEVRNDKRPASQESASQTLNGIYTTYSDLRRKEHANLVVLYLNQCNAYDTMSGDPGAIEKQLANVQALRALAAEFCYRPCAGALKTEIAKLAADISALNVKLHNKLNLFINLPFPQTAFGEYMALFALPAAKIYMGGQNPVDKPVCTMALAHHWIAIYTIAANNTKVGIKQMRDAGSVTPASVLKYMQMLYPHATQQSITLIYDALAAGRIGC